MTNTSIPTRPNSTPASRPGIGVAAVGLAVLVLSLTSTLVKWSGTPGSVIAFWRTLFAMVLWWLIARLLGQAPTWHSLRLAALPGVLFGVNLGIFFTAVTRTSIAQAEFIGSLSPLILAPMGALVLSEAVPWRALAWAPVALIGVALVLFGGSSGVVKIGGGDGLAIIAMLLWCGYLLATKRVRHRLGVAEFMASVTPFATAALTVIVTIRGGVTDVTTRGWLIVVVLLLATALGAQALIVFAQHHVPVATIGMLQIAQPALATLWAAIVLSESIRPVQVMGMVAVLVGLWAFTLRTRR